MTGFVVYCKLMEVNKTRKWDGRLTMDNRGLRNITIIVLIIGTVLMIYGKIQYDQKVEATVKQALNEPENPYLKEMRIKDEIEKNKKKIVIIGHSYVAGYNASDRDNKSFVALISKNFSNCKVINDGIGGTDIDVSSPSKENKNSALDRVDEVIQQKPSLVLVDYGLNAVPHIEKGEISHEQYRKDCTTFLQNIRTALPNIPILISGIISIPSRDDANLKPYNDDIQISSNAVSNCHFINMSGYWNKGNYSTYMSSDKIHPNDAGHEFLSEKYAEAIKPYIK